MALVNAFGNIALDATIQASNVTLTSLDSKLPSLIGSRIPVDGSGVTQPISVLALPLPTGAATDATLASINAKLPPIEGDSVLIADSGLLSAARDSFDTANSTLTGMVLQDDAIPDFSKPTGPALQVTLRDPVQLDPSVAAVTGGIDPTGAVQRTRVGVDGGTQLTDCKQFVGTTQVLNGSPTGWIDTTGYQSIVVTFFGTLAGTAVTQTTNDPTYLVSGGNAAGFATSGSQSAANSLINPTNGSTYVYAVTGKFFRVLCTAYTSGLLGAVVTLRAAPFAYGNVNIPSINITQVGSSTAAANASCVSGSNALGIGGAFKAGFQYGVYNPLYGTYTQTITSSNTYSTVTSVPNNPVTIGGVDSTNASRPLLTDTLGAPAVTSAPSNQSQQSLHELLLQILATLRASVYYQYELAFGSNTRSSADEPDNLIGDFLNQANQFANFTN